jgi:hypothetical protein
MISISAKSDSMVLYPSLLNRLQTQHEAIEIITAGTSSESLSLQPQPGKWSIKDNIAHLAKYQPVFIDRINRIITANNPVLDAYIPEADPEFPLWQTWDTRTLRDTLYADRKQINRLINGLTHSQLTMTGVHKKYGRLTMVQWTEFFLLHEAHHIYTIFKLVNNG